MPSYERNDIPNQAIEFDAIQIGLASPEKIREWSRGEVKKPETINYVKLKPEKDGLFCEKIFGPTKDWECRCGRYKKIRYKGAVCDRCGVEVTKSSVRRERMGHIELAAPVSHIWFVKGAPSGIGLLLDIAPKKLEYVLYFARYIVLDPGETTLEYKEVLTQQQYAEAKSEFGDKFTAGMGAEAIKQLLSEVDLEKEYKELFDELKSASGQKKTKIIKRLEVFDAFIKSGNKPEWMILDVIPVIPPDLRPMVQLDGGRFATSDLNDLYRRIINRNNRLRKLLSIGTPDIIIRNEKRMLQEAVDALIANGKRGRAVTGPGNRALKSLSDMLKGKSGRFRQNLLGKRVDYSGRSVIVVGPELKIYQCGLPKEMALELFKPFVMRELVKRGEANIKSAKKKVERLDNQVWDVLEDVIKEHPVMLNRAPTLHRLGIQAFEPVLVEGKAIKLHPLVCTAYNADFDGDQMAAHLPLTAEAQAECRFMLLSPNNLLKPSDGGVVAVPSQDMVLGIYYMNQIRKGEKGEGRAFHNVNEAIMAHENKELGLHALIKVRVSKTLPDGTEKRGIIETSLGRILFNDVIPQDLNFVDRSKPENEFKLEIDFYEDVLDENGNPTGEKKPRTVKKKDLQRILERIMNIHGATKTAEVLDNIKSMGYKYSTLAAMTVSVSDMTVPAGKAELIKETEKIIDNITKSARRGLLTEEERYTSVVDAWDKTDKKLTRDLMNGLDEYNNIYMMADSGARGSEAQIKQLAGMKGNVQDTTGRTIELPIKSNLREGLDVLEYFMSAHGSRKTLSDTALRTADSGYLTRRLVDVSQELIIRESDCRKEGEEIPGMEVYTFTNEDGEILESLKDRIVGRFTCENIYDENGDLIVEENHMITPARADEVVSRGVKDGEPIKKIKIRNVLNCRCKNGICAKCYGANMASGRAVQVGEAIGIIAAQSIGEPGTQLTMRTFHTGGIAESNITGGLPRVEELFEARKPKPYSLAIVTEISGEVEVNIKPGEGKEKREIIVTEPKTGRTEVYNIPYGSHIKVMTGDEVNAGDPLTEGNIDPSDILKIQGYREVQDYILREVQKVYRAQGVDINDKHIEVIVHQMMRKVAISDTGDSDCLPGSQMDYLEFEEMNKALEAEGKAPAQGERILLGITKKASIGTDSFLSAASFQETVKILTSAAIKGKIDNLIGLKENVIIGKLIPAGTGMKRYSSIKLNSDYDTLMADKISEAEEAVSEEN